MAKQEGNDKSEAKIDSSVNLALEALIRIERDVCYAHGMDKSGEEKYNVALDVIRERQNALIGQFPESLRTPEAVVKLYPALAERVGVQLDEQ